MIFATLALSLQLALAGPVPKELNQAAARMKAAAALILVDGKVYAEWGNTSYTYPCHSVRKSFISALYGIAVEQGKIDLNETLAQLGITDRSPLSEAEQQATVRDLLTSRSGVYHRSNLASGDMLAKLPARGSHPHGTFWYYNNWDFNALATIYQKRTGEDVFTAFDQYIAKPLEFQHWSKEANTRWSDDRESVHRGYEFRLSALDMARFGQLFLNRGRWGGRQIVPARWIEESTRALVTFDKQPGGYGYMWWIGGPGLPEGTYSAQGNGGHMILAVPSHKAVIVTRANTELPGWVPGANRLEVKAVQAFISAAIKRLREINRHSEYY